MSSKYTFLGYSIVLVGLIVHAVEAQDKKLEASNDRLPRQGGATWLFVRVSLNRDTAEVIESFKVKVRDKIQIEYSFPIDPSNQFTGTKSFSSDSSVTKSGEPSLIEVRPSVKGVGGLGALFAAEKKGKARLEVGLFFAKSKAVNLKADVEVE